MKNMKKMRYIYDYLLCTITSALLPIVKSITFFTLSSFRSVYKAAGEREKERKKEREREREREKFLFKQ